MRNVPAIIRREMNAYLFTPLAYVVIFLFLGLTGLFFHNILWTSRDAGLTAQAMFNVMSYVMMLIVPLITMRLVAHEARSGTLETLMTAPVTDVELVLGKYFGALLFYILILVPTLAHILLLLWLADPDAGPIFSGYVGLLFMGAMFISIGLFWSSLTSRQMTAAVLSIISLLLLFVASALPGNRSGWRFDMVRYVGVVARQEEFAGGVVDSRSIVYYVSATVFFLFLSVRAIESRKWR